MTTDFASRVHAAITAKRVQATKLQRYAQENHLMVQDPRHLGKYMPGWHEWPEFEQLAADLVLVCDRDLRWMERHAADPECTFQGCLEVTEMAEAYGVRGEPTDG